MFCLRSTRSSDVSWSEYCTWCYVLQYMNHNGLYLRIMSCLVLRTTPALCDKYLASGLYNFTRI